MFRELEIRQHRKDANLVHVYRIHAGKPESSILIVAAIQYSLLALCIGTSRLTQVPELLTVSACSPKAPCHDFCSFLALFFFFRVEALRTVVTQRKSLAKLCLSDFQRARRMQFVSKNILIYPLKLMES